MCKTSETTTKIYAALLEVQKNISSIKKIGKNPMFKSSYATIDSVLDVVKPLLSEQGVLLMQPVESNDGAYKIKTILQHKDGEFIETQMSLDISNNAKINQMQALGSAITYARRYSLLSLLALQTGEDDDDANNASDIKINQKSNKATFQNQEQKPLMNYENYKNAYDDNGLTPQLKMQKYIESEISKALNAGEKIDTSIVLGKIENRLDTNYSMSKEHKEKILTELDMFAQTAKQEMEIGI